MDLQQQLSHGSAVTTHSPTPPPPQPTPPIPQPTAALVPSNCSAPVLPTLPSLSAAASVLPGLGPDGCDTTAAAAAYSATLAARRRSYGPNTSLSYTRPLMIVRGHGTYLYDEQGQSYLDCVNNVTHLGHGNAEVTSAVCAQLHTLNTNSRYLHPALPEYTEALLATLNYTTTTTTSSSARSAHTRTPTPTPGTSSAPRVGEASTAAAAAAAGTATTEEIGGGRKELLHQAAGCTAGSSSSTHRRPQHQHNNQEQQPGPGPSLDVVYLVCSGSEANDLALRVALAARPGATHVAVMGGAYHGHLTSLVPLSPYKFWGPGGGGRQQHVHVIPCPDPYRGENLDGRAAALAVLEEARRAGGRLAVFFCESVLSCGGQVVLPPGYLQAVYDVFRAAGVVLVADEVQCGFGRCGSAFWGFQTQGLRPDIVTMGKPIGNGYPMAALATSRELATAFAGPGMEYFNTYGGSTAAVAAGLAVLRILQRDDLQGHAQRVGDHLLCGLRRLQAAHEVVGDVRGLGLFLGMEVVVDKTSRRHAPVTARWIKERMKARRVLLSTDGPYENVIKFKPPMVFGIREADTLLRELSEVLSKELTCEVRRDLVRQEDELWAAVMAPRQRHYDESRRALMALLGPEEGAGAAAAGQPGQGQRQPRLASRL